VRAIAGAAFNSLADGIHRPDDAVIRRV